MDTYLFTFLKDHWVWKQFAFTGPCYTFDLSKVDKFKFLQYQGSARPTVEFTFDTDAPWNDVILILHSKSDFPDATHVNGWTYIPSLKGSIIVS